MGFYCDYFFVKHYSLLIKNSLTKWASLPLKFGFLLQLFFSNWRVTSSYRCAAPTLAGVMLPTACPSGKIFITPDQLLLDSLIVLSKPPTVLSQNMGFLGQKLKAYVGRI